MAEPVFWSAAATLFYVYIGYPLLLATVAGFRRQRRADPGYSPSLTVMIAAYNEEARIGRKLAETLALDYPADALEVIVVSDGSTDATERIVAACPDPRVRLIRVGSRMGKTHAQNRGVLAARGEVVVFSDATTSYDRDALRYLACNYADPSVGAVSGIYHYVAAKDESPTEIGSVLFWRYENAIKRMQSKIKSLTGCSGCIYSVRKSVYTPLAPGACSDLVEPLHVVRMGYRVVLEDRAVAWEQTTSCTNDEFRMRVRVAAHGMSGVFGLPELLNVRRYGWISLQLISHKVLRWLVPFFLIALLACSLALSAGAFYRWVLMFQAIFYALGAVAMVVPLHRRWKPLALPLYFCTLNLAALVSVFELSRGRRYVVWDTIRH